MSIRSITVQYIGNVLFLPKLERDVKLVVERDYGTADPDKRFVMERTCRNNKDKWSGLAKYLFVCSECGWNLTDVGNDAIDISARLMKRCPMCGAKVVSE